MNLEFTNCPLNRCIRKKNQSLVIRAIQGEAEVPALEGASAIRSRDRNLVCMTR